MSDEVEQAQEYAIRPIVADILRIVGRFEAIGLSASRDDIRRALSDPPGGMFARVMPYTRADVDAAMRDLESVGLLVFTAQAGRKGRRT